MFRHISSKLAGLAALALATMALFVGLSVGELVAWNAAYDNLVSDNRQTAIAGEFHAALTRAVGEAASFSATGQAGFGSRARVALTRAETALNAFQGGSVRWREAVDPAPDPELESLLERQTAVFQRVKARIDRLVGESRERDPGVTALLEDLHGDAAETDELFGRLQALQEKARLGNAASVLERQQRAMTLVVAALIALGAWFALLIAFVARAVVRPVNALSRVAAGVAEGDFAQAVNVSSRDEIGILQETFNQMIHELWVQRSILAERSAQLARTVESLARSREQAEAANQAKSQFLANVSHEIRTPMNGVLGTCELLQGMPMPDDQRRYVTMAEASAKHLLRIIDDILDFSKIEAGRLDLELTPFNIHHLVAEVFEFVHRKAASKGIQMRAAIAADVSPWQLGDAVRLRQILANLVENAIKFTERGSVLVDVRCAERPEGRHEPNRAEGQPEHRWLKIAVVDTGMGLSQQGAGGVFDAFSQGDGTAARRHGGTGLGLAIVKQLVEMMYGDIHVDSEPGQGATFWFRLPVMPCEEPARALGALDAGDLLAASAIGHVLLAEDNIINREVARAFLTGMGMTVSIAADGAEALERAARDRYDVILMDCQMPVMDGFEATTGIRAMEGQDRRTPVIALTANALEGDRERCLAAGMDDYLAKPISRETLRAVLQRWLPDSALAGERGQADAGDSGRQPAGLRP